MAAQGIDRKRKPARRHIPISAVGCHPGFCSGRGHAHSCLATRAWCSRTCRSPAGFMKVRRPSASSRNKPSGAVEVMACIRVKLLPQRIRHLFAFGDIDHRSLDALSVRRCRWAQPDICQPQRTVPSLRLSRNLDIVDNSGLGEHVLHHAFVRPRRTELLPGRGPPAPPPSRIPACGTSAGLHSSSFPPRLSPENSRQVSLKKQPVALVGLFPRRLCLFARGDVRENAIGEHYAFFAVRPNRPVMHPDPLAIFALGAEFLIEALAPR